MRRRLIISTLVVAFVVVALLGIPLALVEAQSIESRAQAQVRAEATRLLTAIELRQELGEPTDARTFVWQVDRGRHAVVRMPGQATPIVIGAPVRDSRFLTAQLTGSRGEVVTVQESRQQVDAEIGRAILLICVTALLAIGAAIGMAVLQARRLGGPLVDLARTAERLGSGDPRPRWRRYGVPELDRVADVLDRSAQRISRMLAAERQLATDASHQLRTPLTALSMRLEEMITAADNPGVVREEGAAALAQTERLAEVVGQLLGRVARRSVAGAPALASIDDVVAQQVIEWDPAFRRLGRKLEVTGEKGLIAYVTPGSAAQVIATLLDNALVHGAGVVTIRTSQTPRSAVVEVRDEGKGVPQELVPRIFERSVSGRPGGTGLGLSLARSVAAADGGQVVLVRPRPAVFAVFLPRGTADLGDEPVVSGPA